MKEVLVRCCYEAVLERDGVGWSVTFPQLGDYVTSADTRQGAVEAAADLLKLLLAGYVDEGRPFPHPEHVVECLAVTVDLNAEDVEKTHFMTQSQAAGLLGVSPSRVCALVKEGRLVARRFDGRNLVSIESVNLYRDSPRRSGRPATSERSVAAGELARVAAAEPVSMPTPDALTCVGG